MPKDNFDNFIDNLQKEILDKEIEEFNEYIVKLYQNPKNWGRPIEKDISVSKAYTGPCGDTMVFFLRIKDNVIEKANFITDGCGTSVATASQTTLLIEGKRLDYAESLTPEEIDKALKGLPEDHKHCAELAVSTIKRAIKKYKDNLYNEYKKRG